MRFLRGEARAPITYNPSPITHHELSKEQAMPDTPVKDRKDAAAEIEAKQQLVDCIRMLERSDIIDYNGHASIRAR